MSYYYFCCFVYIFVALTRIVLTISPLDDLFLVLSGDYKFDRIWLVGYKSSNQGNVFLFENAQGASNPKIHIWRGAAN